MSALAAIGDFTVTVLAIWLGASVLIRAPREYPSRVFGLLTLLIAIWSGARLISGLTADGGVRLLGDGVEAAAAAVLPAALLHMVLSFIPRPHWSLPQRAALVTSYLLGLLMGGLAIANPALSVSLNPPYWEVFGLPGPVSGLIWIGTRAVILLLAGWWAWQAWRAAAPGSPRRNQLQAVLYAVALGAAGGITFILTAQLGGPVVVGFVLVLVSLALTTYAVFVQRVLFSVDAGRYGFYYAAVTGLFTVVYLGGILLLERLAQGFLAISAPVVTGLALVLTVAVFDPVRRQLRGRLDERLGRKDTAQRQMLRALGDEMLASPEPERATGSALDQICRTLGIRAGSVRTTEGRVLAAYGPPVSAPALRLELQTGSTAYGVLQLGPKRSGFPYSPDEVGLLSEVAAYIAASLHLAARQSEQLAALETISRERDELRAREAALADSLVRTAPVPATGKLHVYALGPLRVERDGEPVRRWGGAKAGTRQAEAMFAFLFDRGERGVGKDELIEVIWPEIELEKADLAFHRTLGGLRRTLEPDLRRGSESRAITYYHDRYRLNPELIEWSDVEAFERCIVAARAGGTPSSLEEARALYRGAYLDDCPFYGDSVYVEERRSLLRGRYIDVLLALGEWHEQHGDPTTAAGYYREALQAADDDCPRADDGLARLGLPL